MEKYFQINENGHNIRCKLYCRELSAVRGVVIFAHGFGGHKDNNAAAKFAEKLISKHKHMAMITFDWPCHGDDVKKKLYLADCITYLDMVIACAKQKFQTEELYSNATSFGGYLTLKYISEKGNPFRKVALRCPAVGMYDVLTGAIIQTEELDRLRKGREIPVGFDRKVMVSPQFLEELKNNDIREQDFLDYAEDILIIHGTADEIVPYGAAKDFSENQLIELVSVEGADHRFRDPKKMELANKYMLEFYGL